MPSKVPRRKSRQGRRDRIGAVESKLPFVMEGTAEDRNPSPAQLMLLRYLTPDVAASFGELWDLYVLEEPNLRQQESELVRRFAMSLEELIGQLPVLFGDADLRRLAYEFALHVRWLIPTNVPYAITEQRLNGAFDLLRRMSVEPYPLSEAESDIDEITRVLRIRPLGPGEASALRSIQGALNGIPSKAMAWTSEYAVDAVYCGNDEDDDDDEASAAALEEYNWQLNVARALIRERQASGRVGQSILRARSSVAGTPSSKHKQSEELPVTRRRSPTYAVGAEWGDSPKEPSALVQRDIRATLLSRIDARLAQRLLHDLLDHHPFIIRLREDPNLAPQDIRRRLPLTAPISEFEWQFYRETFQQNPSCDFILMLDPSLPVYLHASQVGGRLSSSARKAHAGTARLRANGRQARRDPNEEQFWANMTALDGLTMQHSGQVLAAWSMHCSLHLLDLLRRKSKVKVRLLEDALSRGQEALRQGTSPPRPKMAYKKGAKKEWEKMAVDAILVAAYMPDARWLDEKNYKAERMWFFVKEFTGAMGYLSGDPQRSNANWDIYWETVTEASDELVRQFEQMAATQHRRTPVNARSNAHTMITAGFVGMAAKLTITREQVEDALQRTGWRASDAANFLGVSRAWLHNYMTKHQIRPNEEQRVHRETAKTQIRSSSQRQRWDATSPEARTLLSQTMRKRQEEMSPEARERVSQKLSKIAKSRRVTMSPEERAEFMQRSSEATRSHWATMTPEERTRQLSAMHSHESRQRSAQSVMAWWAKMSPEEREEQSRLRESTWDEMSPEVQAAHALQAKESFHSKDVETQRRMLAAMTTRDKNAAKKKPVKKK